MARTSLTSLRAAVVIALSAFGAGSAVPAHAAFVSICDAEACGSADPNITFNLNDFERGFFINGVLAQDGLGRPATLSVSEAGAFVDGAAQTTFSGSWIDDGQAAPASVTVFLTEQSGGISDVLNFNYSSADGFGTLSGYVISDVNGTLSRLDLAALGIRPTLTVSEAGPVDFSNAFITASFQSDVDAVPEPSIWAMMLLGFAGLGFAGYRKVRVGRAALAA
jgi:hypothetical protein